MWNASMHILNARRNRVRGCSKERKIFSPFTRVEEGGGGGDRAWIRKNLCTVEEKFIATREKEKKERMHKRWRMRWRKKRRRTKRKKWEKKQREDDGEKKWMRNEFRHAPKREGRREKEEGVGKVRNPPSFPLRAHTRE